MEELTSLVERSQSGSLEAFGEIVRRFQDMACGYAYSILGDFHLAMDAAQNAFLQAYRDLPALRQPGAFPGWLRRIVLTQCTRMTRGSTVRTVPLDAARGIASHELDPVESAERQEIRDSVLAAVRSLPEDQRIVTTLFYIDGYSQKEIAEFLEVPVTTVNGRLRSSRSQLRERTVKMVDETLKRNAPDEQFSRRVLENIPPGRGNSNSFAQGLCMILNYCGTPAGYDTLMGDSGQAFILQSEEGGPLVDGAVDVGWWPMASWGIGMRLSFVGQTVGREIRRIECNPSAYRADPARHYRDYLAAEVKAAIDASRPVLAEHDIWFVVAGYNAQEPPLLGDWSLRADRATTRMKEYPWGVIVLGDEVDRLDREEADLAALKHAVALGRDATDVRVPMFFEEWEGIKGRFTGQKSYALWAEALRDTERLGQARWHSNMVLHLGINRRSAVAYLQSMAERHAQKVRAHVEAAAKLYEDVAAELARADTGQEAMMSAAGREDLARTAQRIAGIEAQAVAELERALGLVSGRA